MVAGKHQNADAGALTACDRLGHLRARWVHHPDQAKKRQVARAVLHAAGSLASGPAVRDRQHPQPLSAQLVGDRHDLRSVKGTGPVRALRVAAHPQHALRGALGKEDVTGVTAEVIAGREAALRLERDLPGPREGFLGITLEHPGLGSSDQERYLRGVAMDINAPVYHVERRLAVQRSREKERVQRRAGIRTHNLPVKLDMAIQVVAGACHRIRSPGRMDDLNGHAVLGQRPRLIGTDDGAATEGLDGGQRPHDGMAAGHPVNSDGRRDGHHDGQTLGNHGHDESDGGAQHRVNGLAQANAKREDDDAGGDAGGSDNSREPGHSPLQGAPGLLRLLYLTSDPAQLRRHPGGRNEGMGTAAGDDGAHIDHVCPVGQGQARLRQSVGHLLDDGRLAGQQRLVHLWICGAYDASVRGDPASRLQEHDVSWHQFPAIDLLVDTSA